MAELRELASRWPDEDLLSQVGEAERGCLGTIVGHYGKGRVVEGPFFRPDTNIDVAAIVVEGIDAPAIPLGQHLDGWLGHHMTLAEVVVFGYHEYPSLGVRCSS